MDPRLQLNFNKDQAEGVLMLGLACCHPNPNKRPSMKVALQILKGEIAPPILPNDKPAFMWLAMDCPEEESRIYFSGGILSPSTELSGR
ncbi:hypothetical protein MKW98_018843 [Papaver atlanticum]|uniref:Uncharacterized protein n=1 Tax=Papaver atlanticum TaxID=357466 RepID=A0AAD4TJ20_9MAGN|nr:hypothetical protein MKW98_018843 [Papaver atlanticum]